MDIVIIVMFIVIIICEVISIRTLRDIEDNEIDMCMDHYYEIDAIKDIMRRKQCEMTIDMTEIKNEENEEIYD